MSKDYAFSYVLSANENAISKYINECGYWITLTLSTKFWKCGYNKYPLKNPSQFNLQTLLAPDGFV